MRFRLPVVVGWLIVLTAPVSAATDRSAAKIALRFRDSPAAETASDGVAAAGETPVLKACLSNAASQSIPNATDDQVSLAERIARVERTVEADEAHLQTLKQKLGEQEKEFEEAGDEFKQVDTQMEDKKVELAAAQDSGDTEKAQQLGAAIVELDKKWRLSRERFDLAIAARKTAEEQIHGLETKIAQDRKSLRKLLKPADLPNPAREGQDRPMAEPQLTAESSSRNPLGAKKGSAASLLPGTAAITSAIDDAAPPAPPPVSPTQLPDREVLQAQAEAAKAERAAKEAESEVEEIDQRLEMLDKNIRLEQQAREAARKQGDNGEATLGQLGDELQKALDEGALSEVIREVRRKMAEAQSRLAAARAEVGQRAERIDTLQAQRSALLSEQLLADQSLEQQRQKAKESQEELKAIRNPLAPHNVLRWLAEKGPKLLAVLLVVFGLHVLIKVVANRIVVFITGRDSNGKRTERENRANTLVGVFQNTAIVVLYTGASLTALELSGIPIAPLLGGAAVVGLAVAFAAQNLIKDYFYGFMILLEDQYGVNDVVTIGGVTGFVERITLRVTVLRSLDAVHFVPHGQITTVSNLTHKWSRAVFDIGVSYNADADRVMEVLLDLGRRMRLDPSFGKLILEDPEMLGVDSFADSAVIIKFFMKTRPMQQWAVKREMLRRIKKRFDELGIEIPFPHRTVYHRYEEGAAESGGRPGVS